MFISEKKFDEMKVIEFDYNIIVVKVTVLLSVIFRLDCYFTFV